MVVNHFGVLSEMPSATVTDVAVLGSAMSYPVASTTKPFLPPESLIQEAQADLLLLGAGARNGELALRALRHNRDVIVASPWHLTLQQFVALALAAREQHRALLFSQPAIWAGDIVIASRAIVLKGERPSGVRGTIVTSDPADLTDQIEQAMAISRLLLGVRPDTVSAAGGMQQASLQLFYEGGQNAQFQLSAGEPHRERTLTLLADGRSWRLDLDQPRRLTAERARGRVVPLRRVEPSPLRSPAGLEAVHLLRVYLGDERPILGVGEVHDIIVAAEAARRSLLGLGAPIQTAAITPVRPKEIETDRPKLRTIEGGGMRSAALRPALTIVS